MTDLRGSDAPFNDILPGRGAMAAYYYGADTPKNRRRISALMREVKEADRIPYYMDGGRPASRKSWLDQYQIARRRNPVITRSPPAPFSEPAAASQS
jgi:hypothetical protein